MLKLLGILDIYFPEGIHLKCEADLTLMCSKGGVRRRTMN